MKWLNYFWITLLFLALPIYLLLWAGIGFVAFEIFNPLATVPGRLGLVLALLLSAAVATAICVEDAQDG